MSKAKGKTKGKDKKNQNVSAQQQLIDQQKRQILEQSFTIRRLQDRLSRMTEENYEVTTTRDKVQQEYEERIDKQRIIIDSHENNIRENRGKIYDLQVGKMTLQNKVRDLERQLKQLQIQKSKEFQEFKRTAQNEMSRLEIQLKEYNYYMGQRDQMSRQNKDLRYNVQNEKEERVREVADKEREKVQAVDKIRDEMLTTIKNMRTNLLSLKADQLDATTRLAVLQNHQLTSQLEFQSKQSEKLIFQNEQLTKKVSNLQKDLQIHRQIEDELAKRSHYSRGIIKKLTNKIAELEESLKEAGEKASQLQEKGQVEDPSDELRRDEVIRTLDRSLESTEKKFLKLQSQSQANRGELQTLRSKVEHSEKLTNGLLQVLLRAYRQLQSGQLQGKEGDYKIDLSQLRKKPLGEWSTPELKLVMFALLEKLSKLLTRRNLGISRPVAEQTSVIDTDEGVNNVRLPKLGEHSTNSRLELSLKLKEMPVGVGSKLVGSQVREWGRTVHSSSQANLIRKYRLNDR